MEAFAFVSGCGLEGKVGQQCWQLGRKSGCKAQKQDKQDIAGKTVTLEEKLDLVFGSNFNFTLFR